MTHLTLRLTRTKGSWDTIEEHSIRVDLPLDAEELELRLAFAHVVERVVDEVGVRHMDGAAGMVASLVETREAREDRPPSVESRIAEAMPEHPLNVARQPSTPIAHEGTGAPMTHGELDQVEQDVAAEDALRDARARTPIEPASVGGYTDSAESPE